MGFQAIKHGPGGLPATDVAIGCMYRGAGLRFGLRLPLAVMNRLGLSHGSQIGLGLGSGKDAGWLQVVPNDPKGLVLFKPNIHNKAGYSFNASMAGTARHAMASCKHKFIDGALYVELPKWARAKTGKAA